MYVSSTHSEKLVSSGQLIIKSKVMVSDLDKVLCLNKFIFPTLKSPLLIYVCFHSQVVGNLDEAVTGNGTKQEEGEHCYTLYTHRVYIVCVYLYICVCVYI